MKKLALAGVAAVAFGGGSPALAAGGWTGVYVNGGIGYGSWSADTTTVNSTTGVCTLCYEQRQGGRGEVGKIGVGYDRQFTPNFVAGVLVDYDFTNLKGTIQDQGPFFAGSIKQESAWGAGARFGWLFNPETLTYFNVGYSRTKFSGASMVTTFAGASSAFSTPSFNKDGWFFGLGMETRMTGNWFVRGEYRYASYDSTSLADTSGAVNAARITFKPVVQTGTIEAVYRF